MDMISWILAGVAAIVLWAVTRPWPWRGGTTEPTERSLPATKPDAVPQAVWQWADMVERIYNEEMPNPLQPRHIMAMIWRESGGDADATGSFDEVGLLQIRQAALKDARTIVAAGLPSDVAELDRAEPNLRAGMRYAIINRKRLNRYGDPVTVRNVIRQHNGGPTGHRKSATTAYADDVLAKAAAFA